MAQRVFVFGANGMLGALSAHYLAHRGYQVVPLSRKEFDAAKDSLESLDERFGFTGADVLINAIGVTNRQNGTLPADVFEAINARFPKTLDELAKRTGASFVHVTTDCVFDGKAGGYWEEHAPNAHDVYGVSKSHGEDLQQGIILRTSLVGIETTHHHNLISWILAQGGKTVDGYTNHTWNGITTLQCAKIFETFLKEGFPEPGLYHVFSPRIVTKFQLVEMIARVFDVSLHLAPHHTDQPVLRHLVSTKPLCASLAIPDIETQLEEMREYCDTAGIPWKST